VAALKQFLATGDSENAALKDRYLLFISIFIQSIIGILFGHVYDQRIYLATGYLVGTGQNPYLPQNLTAIFHNSLFQGMTSIGYPPPWPLVLGLIYRCTYYLYTNLLVYNLAIKIPIIAANICLAYLVAAILKDLRVAPENVRRAWLFMLFNPFLLYTTSAWGQFDSIVALLTLASLVLLDAEKTSLSAILLALSLSLKPLAFPIIPVVIIFLLGKSLGKAIRYLLVLTAGIILFCIIPFFGFNWSLAPIFGHWNAHFTVGGGISLLSFYELWKDTYLLPENWWFVGLIWIPALAIASLTLRHGVWRFRDLLRKSTALVFVLFLTRTWLSEPNIVILIPLLVILVSSGELNPLALTLVWVVPLVFTFFNTAPFQLLFPSFPEAMQKLLHWSDEYRTLRLGLRTLTVIPWQITGWYVVVVCLRKNPAFVKLAETMAQIA
jgi:hypothetical protein